MAHYLTSGTVYFHIPLRFWIFYLNDTFFSFSHNNIFEDDQRLVAGQVITQDQHFLTVTAVSTATAIGNLGRQTGDGVLAPAAAPSDAPRTHVRGYRICPCNLGRKTGDGIWSLTKARRHKGGYRFGLWNFWLRQTAFWADSLPAPTPSCRTTRRKVGPTGRRLISANDTLMIFKST